MVNELLNALPWLFWALVLAYLGRRALIEWRQAKNHTTSMVDLARARRAGYRDGRQWAVTELRQMPAGIALLHAAARLEQMIRRDWDQRDQRTAAQNERERETQHG